MAENVVLCLQYIQGIVSMSQKIQMVHPNHCIMYNYQHCIEGLERMANIAECLLPQLAACDEVVDMISTEPTAIPLQVVDRVNNLIQDIQMEVQNHDNSGVN